MGFLDNLGDAFSGKTSADTAKVQFDIANKAIDSDNKSESTKVTLIVVVIITVLVIAAGGLFFLLKSKNS